MKHTTLSVLLLFILFAGSIELSSSSAHAENHILPKAVTEQRPTTTTATATPTPPPASTTDADTAQFEQQLQEHRASLAKKTQDRVYNLLQNITGRMNAAVFRFNNIAYRIETRASLMTKEGKTTGDAQTHLDKAHAALTNVTRILASDLGSFARSENPQERFVNVQVQIKESNAYLHDAQTELHAALNALAQGVSLPSPVATSTATTSKP